MCLQDYPSISQIASKVEDNGMNVIFAVTVDQTARYKELSDLIQASVTGELAGDSSNIVDLVKENYKVMFSYFTPLHTVLCRIWKFPTYPNW